MANLQTMVFARRHGLRVSLLSEDTEIHVLQGESISLPCRDGWSLSVFAVDGPCRGVSIRGTYYPLNDAELLPSFPLGVSNCWSEEYAEISVDEGILMVILSSLRHESPVCSILSASDTEGEFDVHTL